MQICDLKPATMHCTCGRHTSCGTLDQFYRERRVDCLCRRNSLAMQYFKIYSRFLHCNSFGRKLSIGTQFCLNMHLGIDFPNICRLEFKITDIVTPYSSLIRRLVKLTVEKFKNSSKIKQLPDRMGAFVLILRSLDAV